MGPTRFFHLILFLRKRCSPIDMNFDHGISVYALACLCRVQGNAEGESAGDGRKEGGGPCHPHIFIPIKGSRLYNAGCMGGRPGAIFR